MLSLKYVIKFRHYSGIKVRIYLLSMVKYEDNYIRPYPGRCDFLIASDLSDSAFCKVLA